MHFDEWYFICASFNPAVDEDDSFVFNGPQTDPTNPAISLDRSTNYWLNHINPIDGSFTNFSNYGNKCKVEIISKTDLLRARGFRV